MVDRPLLQVKDVAKSFFENAKEFKVLDLVRFDLTERDFVCVVGPSGSGKSTLLRIIVGLEKPTSGEVFFEGEPIRADNPQVAMVFQSFALFPWLTVEKNVELGLEAKGTLPEERRNLDLVHAVEHLLQAQLEFRTHGCIRFGRCVPAFRPARSRSVYS